MARSVYPASLSGRDAHRPARHCAFEPRQHEVGLGGGLAASSKGTAPALSRVLVAGELVVFLQLVICRLHWWKLRRDRKAWTGSPVW
jgi:hypothetical protein